MNPKSIRNLAMVRGTDGLLRLEMVDACREVILDPLAELIWDLSDGSRSLEDLAQAAGRASDRVVPQEEVFSALDFLADAGLIEERVAPPVAEGKVSRRSLLVQMAPVVGAAAWMMSGASARAGGLFPSQEGSAKEQTKEQTKETQTKENQTRETSEKETRDKEDRRKDDRKEDAGRVDDRESARKERSRVWYDQHKGRIDLTGKYAVNPNHPLLGKWKFVADDGKAITLRDSRTKATLVWTFSSRGIAESEISSISYTSKRQNNWKYASTGPRTGVLEGFLGELVYRGDIRWISRNEFEYTVTLDPFPDVIGERLRFVRDY